MHLVIILIQFDGAYVVQSACFALIINFFLIRFTSHIWLYLNRKFFRQCKAENEETKLKEDKES